MKKSHVIADHENCKLIVTKAFYKKASIVGSPEYYELRRAMNENKEYSIVIKSIDKKTYRGLSFATMEEYIKTQPNSEKILVKFAAVKRIAKAKGSLYPLTKKWFLNTFPAYKENEIAEDTVETLTAELELQAAAELEAIMTDKQKKIA